ncbi:capsule assembly Wzi family protein [Pedobacter sp. UYP1]|uniref:capsule assembly Wzi family protein n=1 Tax=Pedobacter sp. UYP1 TaxID=1756396 RepID=UPI003390D82F
MSFIENINNKLILVSAALLALTCQLKAQTFKGIKAEVETQAIGTTSGVVPFWMRSNQFGSTPSPGASASFMARFHRDYNTPSSIDSTSGKKKLIDWGFGFEGRANAGKDSEIQLIEAYAKVRAGIFQLKGGRTKDVMGLNGDTTLSSGNFSVSGNALGIPKIELSIPDYYTIPAFNGLFAIKGNFTHGWVGKTRILDVITGSQSSNQVYQIQNTHPTTYFHQKSLYVRLGRKDWKLKLYGGFNHQVYWGNEKEAYGPNFKLSPLKSFFYVATGKSYGAAGVPTSKIGNQLGSVDLGAEYDFTSVKVMVYRQTFYDVGALSKLANIRDGLNGISFENKNYDRKNRGFEWKKALFEFFYSKDQAGYPWSIPTKSGDEDYYNNFYYMEGWSYNGLGVGNPLITTRDDARKGQAYRYADNFINNRVVAVHFGLSGSVKEWDFTTKLTYSKNYGTFGTSIYGGSTGSIRNPQTTNIFVPVDQFSFYLEGMRPLNKGYSVGFATALDQGKLLYNSYGLLLKLRKSW